MRIKIACFSLIFASLYTASAVALPPAVPSAGVVERELQKEYEGKPLEPEKRVPSIQIDIPEARLHFPDGKKVCVRTIRIWGNEAVSTRKIEKWVKGYLNKKLSLNDIYKLCQVIEQHYAKMGYFLARAYPPPQDMEDDELEIDILEGKLGNIQIIGNKYYSTSFIRSYFTSLQHKPLQYDEFLKALMLLNENSDLLAGAIFEKGKELGCADVVLRIDDARPVHLYLNGNNYGRNLTTNTRAGGRLDYGNVLTQGDMFTLAEVVGFPINALYFTDINYTVPLNSRGTSCEIEYLFSTFKVEELRSLHLKGITNIGTVKIKQALTRTRSLSVDAFSYFDFKQIQDYTLGHRIAFDELRVLTVGALFDHFTPSLGRDYLTLRFAAGIPNLLGGLKAVDSRSSRVGAGGRFFIFNADYDRLQYLPGDCYLYFHGSGQYSFNKLTLPEQIYIGGSDTVRGFPLAIALGDSGYYLNFEFRIPPPLLANKRFFNSNKRWKDIIQFDVFLDNGGTFLKSGSNIFRSGNNTFLWGAGAGVRVNGPWHLTFSIDVGFPLNHRSLTRDVFTYIKLTGQPF